MYQTQVVEEIITHILRSTFFFSENRAVYACWISKAADIHSEYVILLLYGNSGYANALQCYVIGTLPVLFNINVDGTNSLL
jgi:hypothetical protein